MAVAGCAWILADVGCRGPNADVTWNAAVANRSYRLHKHAHAIADLKVTYAQRCCYRLGPKKIDVSGYTASGGATGVGGGGGGNCPRAPAGGGAKRGW
jgi:hypothetical protein